MLKIPQLSLPGKLITSAMRHALVLTCIHSLISTIMKNSGTDQFYGKNFIQKIVLSDDGSILSGATTSIVDSNTKKTVFTTVHSLGVVICSMAL
jgi:hypothetical protein